MMNDAATRIFYEMRTLFSDALMRFSLRCFRLERLILLQAPAGVVKKEEKLIEEARSQFLPGDEDKIAALISFEMIKWGVNEFDSPNCGNCIYFHGGGDCSISKACNDLYNAGKDNLDEAVDNFWSAADTYNITDNADRLCIDYRLDENKFNRFVEEATPIISALEKRHGINLGKVVQILHKMLVDFANRTIPTPPGSVGVH